MPSRTVSSITPPSRTEFAATPARRSCLRRYHDPHRRRRDAARVVGAGDELTRRRAALSWQRRQYLASNRLRRDVPPARLQHAARRLSRIWKEHRFALGAGHLSRCSGSWRWLTETKGIAAGDIVLFGESLGGAVAAWLAAREQPRALVLASTFTSVPDLGAEIYPFLPVRLVQPLRIQHARCARTSARAGARRAQPARRHHSVLTWRALFAAAREPKAFLELRGGHNDGFIFTRPEWVRALGAFLDRAGQSSATSGTDAGRQDHQ